MEDSKKPPQKKPPPVDTSDDGVKSSGISLDESDCPYPTVTQSKNDNVVDVSTSLYCQSGSSRHLVRYMVTSILGKGHYGTVFLAVQEGTGNSYALKTMKKSVRNVLKYAYVEEGVLRIGRKCPFVIHLYNSFQSDNAYYLVMEHASGGNLKQVIEEHGVLSVDVARYLMAEVVIALQFLHDNGVIHRDLKIQNVLLSSRNHVRLIDFGLSKLGVFGDDVTGSGCGTPFYMAPEILRRIPYGHQVDWWAMGVLLYKIVTGTFPFMGKTNPEVFVAVTRDTVHYDNWIPADLVQFLKGLLTRSPAKRLGKAERKGHDIKSHVFFKDIDWDLVRTQKLEVPIGNMTADASSSGTKVHGKSRQKRATARRLSASQDMTKDDQQGPGKLSVPSAANRSWSPVTELTGGQTGSMAQGLKSIEAAKSGHSEAVDNESVKEREVCLNDKYPYLTGDSRVEHNEEGHLAEFTLARQDNQQMADSSHK